MLAEILAKGKSLNREALQPFIIPAIVVLVGISAFALGRLSAVAQGGVPSSAIVGQ